MKDLRVGLLLHFFQPYWQFEDVFKRITDQCYRPIFKFIRNNPAGFAFTANINYSLIELLEKYGQNDVLEDIKFAISHNFIELVGTAAYHPILPLLPEKEAERQIVYDFERKKERGIIKNSKGFFFPEMAFSKSCLLLSKRLGYNWTVAEDVAVSEWRVPFDYILTNQDFFVFLRSKKWSNRISFKKLNFQEFADKLNWEWHDWTGGRQSYLIIAMDAETFGHHVPGLNEALLFPMLEKWGNLIIKPFENLLNVFPHREIGEIRDCSWSTSYDDLYGNNPFPLWNDKHNGHHWNLWKLVELALQYADDPRVVNDCLRMVNSCHWWWISRDHWNPGLMITGARKALEVVNLCGSKEEKKAAQIYFNNLSSLL